MNEQLKGFLTLLWSGFRETNAEYLWELGLDFAEDESLGRKLEVRDSFGDLLVRVSWADEAKQLTVLHIFRKPSIHFMIEINMEQLT